MADEFRLTNDERLQLLPSGKQATIANRVHWALSYLGRARAEAPEATAAAAACG